jgi:hypothetical protein
VSFKILVEPSVCFNPKKAPCKRGEYTFKALPKTFWPPKGTAAGAYQTTITGITKAGVRKEVATRMLTTGSWCAPWPAQCLRPPA